MGYYLSTYLPTNIYILARVIRDSSLEFSTHAVRDPVIEYEAALIVIFPYT